MINFQYRGFPSKNGLDAGQFLRECHCYSSFKNTSQLKPR